MHQWLECGNEKEGREDLIRDCPPSTSTPVGAPSATVKRGYRRPDRGVRNSVENCGGPRTTMFNRRVNRVKNLTINGDLTKFTWEV